MLSGLPLADVRFCGGPRAKGEAERGSQVEMPCSLQVRKNHACSCIYVPTNETHAFISANAKRVIRQNSRSLYTHLLSKTASFVGRLVVRATDAAAANQPFCV